VLTAFAAHVSAALERARLAEAAAEVEPVKAADRMRTALLAAVGHDLRTPLAGIKAAASGLRQPDLDLPAAAQAELLATIEESVDRLDALVDNLLSMSRLQAGVLSVQPRPVPLDAVVAQALLHIPTGDAPVDVDIPDDLPLTFADPGLLERVVANLVTNAQAASPPDRPVRIHGQAEDGQVRLQVIDRGLGVPEADRDRIFAPFQRLHDRTTTAGLGLGLAIARGFTHAMGGTIVPSDTPGGGLTMTVTMPAATTTAVAAPGTGTTP
jgi:two-component system sensor histidine kinase KdpD